VGRTTEYTARTPNIPNSRYRFCDRTCFPSRSLGAYRAGSVIRMVSSDGQFVVEGVRYSSREGEGTYPDIGLRESTRHQVLAQPEISEFDVVVCVQEDCEPNTSHKSRATGQFSTVSFSNRYEPGKTGISTPTILRLQIPMQNLPSRTSLDVHPPSCRSTSQTQTQRISASRADIQRIQLSPQTHLPSRYDARFPLKRRPGDPSCNIWRG
jgi:hypothetical protein